MKASDQVLQVGDYVVFYLPEEKAKEVYGRSWFDNSTTFLKKVGAMPGDTYLSREGKFYINDDYIADIASVDKQGLPLPQLSSTVNIVQSNCFVPISTEIPNSFDGRYYGSVPEKCIKFKVVPVILFD